MADYSIWVLEYARAPESLAAFLLHGQPGMRELPFSLTVLQSDDHTVLVDTGFINAGDSKIMAEADGITLWANPVEVLGRIGIEAAEVDTVILTHAHYDHLGDLDTYPNATMYLQRRELEKWTWALGLPPRMQWLKDGVNRDDLDAARELIRRGRLALVDGTVAGVLPSVTLEPDFDTHTYGHQHVLVETEADGGWVLPGDAVYSHVNLVGVEGDGRYVPIGYATGSWENILFAFDRMLESVAGDVDRILPGHDFELWNRHPSLEWHDGLRAAEITLRPGDRSRLARSGERAPT
jgi:glyoxylase-like metal-dependent hydrolase (beta-lactamase superfamily II)